MRMRHRTVTACLLLPVLVICCPLYGAESRVVRFEPGEARYYRLDGGSGSGYAAFLPDGGFTFISREHMMVEETDRGTWKQDADGTVTASSEFWYQNIATPAFEVSHMRVQDARDRLTTLAATLRKILADDPETTMTPKALQERMHALNGRWLSFVSVTPPDRQQISTADLRELLATIENPGLRHEVQRVVPRELKGIVFLEVLQPYHFPWFGLPLEAAEKYVREAKDKTRPFLTAVEVPKEVFERESGRTQEFRYLGRK
jgi:hypothetical protein